jgi:hypothetical protein
MGKKRVVSYIYPNNDERKAMIEYGKRVDKALALAKESADKLGKLVRTLRKGKKFVDRFNNHSNNAPFTWDPYEEPLRPLIVAPSELENTHTEIKTARSVVKAIGKEAYQLEEKVFCGEHFVEDPKRIPAVPPKRFGEPFNMYWTRCDHLPNPYL